MARLTRDELIERVRRIIDVDGTDEELEILADEINANVPHPDIIDLVYDENDAMTPQEIIDKALSYTPRSLSLPASMARDEEPDES
jgi:hypothetical protein